MGRDESRQFSPAFKEAAVLRILAGEKVRAVAAALGLCNSVLYAWRQHYERGGPDALLPRGRPTKAAARARREALAQEGSPPAWLSARGGQDLRDARVRELERKVAQQALELDFFKAALRAVKAPRRGSSGRGATGSSRSSTR